MKVEDIKSDELVEMTESFHRAFNTHGCDPQCHSCEKDISPKDMFKLATVESVKKIPYSYPDLIKKDIKKYISGEESISKEVMLCSKCTAEDYKKMTLKGLKKKLNTDEYRGGGGCFRVNGKIIH